MNYFFKDDTLLFRWCLGFKSPESLLWLNLVTCGFVSNCKCKNHEGWFVLFSQPVSFLYVLQQKKRQKRWTPLLLQMTRKVHLSLYCFFLWNIRHTTVNNGVSFNVPAADLKEEKEAQKPEEATKLQNGDGSKEAAASAAAAGAASEEKKKAKTRFMFNIADGGFTGTNRHTLTYKHT